MKGKIISISSGAYQVLDEGKLYRLKIKGKKIRFLKDSEFQDLRLAKRIDFDESNPFTIGDIVDFVETNEGEGLLIAKDDRINCFRKWNLKTGRWQVLAANVDSICIITSFCQPPVKTLFLDKALVMAYCGGVLPIIVFGKSDLAKSETESKFFEFYSSFYNTRHLSTFTLEGISDFKSSIIDQDVLFFGQSGVGKSSLINSLLSENIKTSPLNKFNYGKHTTTFSYFYKHGNGGIIDSPGVRDLAISNLEPNDISDAFIEFKEYSLSCKLKSCSHVHETQCAVKDALLLSKICKFRYDNYIKILKENEESSIKF